MGEIKKIKTYIEDFDEGLEGGIPEGHVVLVSGTPGTMKSSVSYNILYYNALNEKVPSLYITLEQGRESIITHMANMGMPIEPVKDILQIVDLGFLRKYLSTLDDGKTAWIDIFKMYAKNLKDTLDYKMLVLDSLPALEILAKLKDRRTELFDFFEWLRDLKITTFIISESSGTANQTRDEDFLSDGILVVKKEQIGNAMVRMIIIDKMRSTNHDTNWKMLMIKKGGFQIAPVIANI